MREAADAASGLRLAREDPPELALVDLRLPDGSGLEAVRTLRELDPSTSVVVLTGYGSIATALEAVRLGAAHYLTKPADVDEILAAFARVKATAPAQQTAAAASACHAVAGAGRVGAHQPRARRLRRQHLGGGARARHPPPLAPAQALQVPDVALTGAYWVPRSTRRTRISEPASASSVHATTATAEVAATAG